MVLFFFLYLFSSVPSHLHLAASLPLFLKHVLLFSFLTLLLDDICSSVDGFGLEAEARMTTWHVMIPSDIEPDGVYNQDVSEGNNLQ